MTGCGFCRSVNSREVAKLERTARVLAALAVDLAKSKEGGSLRCETDREARNESRACNCWPKRALAAGESEVEPEPGACAEARGKRFQPKQARARAEVATPRRATKESCFINRAKNANVVRSARASWTGSSRQGFVAKRFVFASFFNTSKRLCH